MLIIKYYVYLIVIHKITADQSDGNSESAIIAVKSEGTKSESGLGTSISIHSGVNH